MKFACTQSSLFLAFFIKLHATKWVSIVMEISSTMTQRRDLQYQQLKLKIVGFSENELILNLKVFPQRIYRSQCQ